MSNAEDKPRVGAGTAAAEPESAERRRLLARLGLGVVGAALVAPVVLSVRACVPNALYEQPQRFKAGRLDSFAEGATFLAAERVFVFRQGRAFHCLSAVCTHLGCTVQQITLAGGDGGERIEFHCPCHGSKYRDDGRNFEGPAPRPLPHLLLDIAPDDGQLIVDLGRTTDAKWRLKG